MKNFTRTVHVGGKKLKASVNHINALYRTMWPLLNSTANNMIQRLEPTNARDTIFPLCIN